MSEIMNSWMKNLSKKNYQEFWPWPSRKTEPDLAESLSLYEVIFNYDDVIAINFCSLRDLQIKFLQTSTGGDV